VSKIAKYEHYSTRRIIKLNKPRLNEQMHDQFATDTEVRDAIENEARNPSPRITAGAKWILNRHAGLRVQTTEFDLIYSAYEAILSSRNWNKSKVDFPTYVVGVMRSIASNQTRMLATTKPSVIYGQEERDDDDSPSITALDEVLTPEEIIIQFENHAETIEKIEALRLALSDDSTALNILNMLLEHGLSKAEIRVELNLNDKQFWAADRKIQRVIGKLGGKQ
jgi:hypothetical protein